MPKTTLAVALLFAAFLQLPASSSALPPALTMPPASIKPVAPATLANLPTSVNGLGQDFEVYDFGTYSPDLPWYVGNYNDPQNNNWYVPAHQFKNPVYLYHLNPGLVQRQLRNMRTSGIDVLVLHMTMSELAACEVSGACYTPFFDGIWGEVTDVSQSALRIQQQQNLAAILNYASEIGFRKVFIRFDGNIDTGGSWDEAQYQKMWNFIVNTRNLATNSLANSATRLMVDLGGEQIGLGTAIQETYVKRLWTDYTSAFGVSDTVGFSMIPHFVTDAMAWYGAVKPNQYAFDVYGGDTNGDVGQELVGAWNALGAEKSKPIMLMETFTNDVSSKAQLSSTLADNPSMNLTDIIQWPITRTRACPTCDQNIHSAPVVAFASTTQVSNYLPIANAVAIENTDSSLLKIQDVDCANAAGLCTIQGTFGYQPQGSNIMWLVFVTMNNFGRNLSWWACGGAGGGTGQATWMQKVYTYRFDYFRVTSCADVPTGAPDASSFVSFRIVDRVFAGGFD